MTLPFRKVPSTVQPIQTTPSTVRRIDPAEVAAALGAEPVSVRVPKAGPLTLYALRTELYRRLSSGEQPGVAGTGLRADIEVSDQDWARLTALASKLKGPNTAPSAGQVASALLSVALDTVEPTAEPGGERPDPALAKKLAEKVASQT